MKKSKQARAREFSKKEREKILCRDNGECIFCKMKYRMENANPFVLGIREIMHYIPRSQNGLGIEQNGAVGCKHHHEMMDNGNKGRREEMLGLFRDYLQSFYPEWDEKSLKYRKW